MANVHLLIIFAKSAYKISLYTWLCIILSRLHDQPIGVTCSDHCMTRSTAVTAHRLDKKLVELSGRLSRVLFQFLLIVGPEGGDFQFWVDLQIGALP